MVHGANKSGSRNKKYVKTPSGTRIRYTEKRPGRPVCAVTGKPLHGVVRGTANQVKKIGKSKRRPSRPFGGVLSSPAMRKIFRMKARLFSDDGDASE